MEKPPLKIPRADHFCYLDFAARYQPGFRNRVIHVKDVPGHIKRFRGFECYGTCLLFRRELLTYVGERGSVAGYDGEAYAHFLPLDLDAPELEQALESARRLLLFLTEEWEIGPGAIQCWFSGRKGFHLMLQTGIFGRFRPSKRLHYVFSKIREIIAREAGIDMDLTIKDKLRLLRLPNTINQKSGLYKVRLTLDEILGLGPAEILALAEKPRPLRDVDSSGLVPQTVVPPADPASRIFRRVLSMTRERRERVMIDSSLRGEEPEAILCDARKAIWTSHIDEGLRHNSAMRILSQFHISGFDRNRSLQLMLDWNIRNAIDLPESEIINMVDSVYASPHPYSYGCRDSILQARCPYANRLADCGHTTRFQEKKKR